MQTLSAASPTKTSDHAASSSFLLRNKRSSVFEKVQEDAISLGGEWDDAPVAGELRAGAIEGAHSEAKRGVRGSD